MEKTSVNTHFWLLLSVFFSGEVVVLRGSTVSRWSRGVEASAGGCRGSDWELERRASAVTEGGVTTSWYDSQSGLIWISSTVSHTMSSLTSISKCWGPGFLVSLTALPTAYLDLTIKETNATLHSSSKNTIKLKSYLLFTIIINYLYITVKLQNLFVTCVAWLFTSRDTTCSVMIIMR